MKCQVPQISWHSRDPVLSIDFQPIQNDLFRLASGGTDSHVLIWYITYEENKSLKLECACDLYRHNKSVNVVRFSPSGEFLASGDDEGTMFIWELKEREQMIDLPNDDEDVNKEEWYPVKLLRGHLDDIYDICWSKDGNFLVSASMDNTAIIWDMQKYVKTHIFSDFKGYVQGVTWDPCNQFIASVGSDRTLRIHNINSKKSVYKITKAPWTNSTEKGTFKARLFYDDTLQSYFRRLTFTPDGEFLIVPTGILEKGEKINNTCYIFSRYALNKPVISLPTGDKYTVAVKCNPLLYKLRRGHDITDKENQAPKSMINLPYRMIFAVAASDSVLMYDTEQLVPFAYISNIHYTHLTDLSWSSDGLTLVVSSTDGYCSFILFTKQELGELYVPEKPEVTEKESDSKLDVNKSEKMDTNESYNIVVSNAEKDKNTNVCNSPKSSSSITTKSPNLISNNAKDDSVTSSKIKVTENKNPAKKTPKMISIKKFFVSPKSVVSTSVSSNAEKAPKNKIAGASNNAPEPEVITLSDSPLKEISCIKKFGTASSKKPSISENPEHISPIKEREEKMDIDDNPADNETWEISKSSGKKSKCKVRLDFTDNVEPIAVIDDNATDINLKSRYSPNESKNCGKRKIKEEENDWKLELSQDEEIVPMEITSTVPNSKAEIPISLDLKDTSKTVKQLPTDAKTEVSKPTESKEASKRRVAFVTLSSRSTFKK